MKVFNIHDSRDGETYLRGGGGKGTGGGGLSIVLLITTFST